MGSKKRKKIDPRVCDVSCHHIVMEMEYPRTRGHVESFLWYLYHERIEAVVDTQGRWFLRGLGRCEQLTGTGRCSVSERQPEICAEGIEEDARVLTDVIRHRFVTEKELLSYLRDRRPALFAKLDPATQKAVCAPPPPKTVTTDNPPGDGSGPFDCALCCKYLNIVVERPGNPEDVNTLLWYMYHDHAKLYYDVDGDWSVVFDSRCDQLDGNNLCRVYERRPGICRKFSSDGCHGKDFSNAVRVAFDTDRDLIAYFKKKRPGLFKKLSPRVRSLAR